MTITTEHIVSNLPSDTYDGPFDHDRDTETSWCRRCIADRAVLSVLLLDDAAVERGARVLVEDGQFGVPWEDASDRTRAETTGSVRAILDAAMGGK